MSAELCAPGEEPVSRGVANLLRIGCNPNLHIREIVVSIGTKPHSCDGQCGVRIERREPAVSVRVGKPKGGFVRYYHLGCKPEDLEARPLVHDARSERRALRWLAQSLSAARTMQDVPEVAWTVLATLRNVSVPF